MSRRAAVLTASDGVSAGSRLDESGDVVSSILEGAGFSVEDRVAVADDADVIEQTLRGLCATS